MDNLVGNNLPTSEKLKGLLKKLIEVRAELEKFGVVLDPQTRRRRIHMRKNALQYVPLLQDLIKKNGLEVPSIPLQNISNDARLVAELSPFEDEAAAISQLISDSLAEAEHEIWQAFLMYYGILKSASTRSPEIKAAIKPLEELMTAERSRPTPSPNLPAPPAP
jgi:hypothetical protein